MGPPGAVRQGMGESRDPAGGVSRMKDTLGYRLAERARRFSKRLGGLARVLGRDRLADPLHCRTDGGSHRCVSQSALLRLSISLLRGLGVCHDGLRVQQGARASGYYSGNESASSTAPSQGCGQLGADLVLSCRARGGKESAELISTAALAICCSSDRNRVFHSVLRRFFTIVVENVDQRTNLQGSSGVGLGRPLSPPRASRFPTPVPCARAMLWRVKFPPREAPLQPGGIASRSGHSPLSTHPQRVCARSGRG